MSMFCTKHELNMMSNFLTLISLMDCSLLYPVYVWMLDLAVVGLRLVCALQPACAMSLMRYSGRTWNSCPQRMIFPNDL